MLFEVLAVLGGALRGRRRQPESGEAVRAWAGPQVRPGPGSGTRPRSGHDRPRRRSAAQSQYADRDDGRAAQEGITRDNVTVKVDAVVYFRVIDPVRAVVNVQDYPFAVSQVAQTSLRSVIGKSDLDDLLTNRERLNEGLELMIDNPAVEWGIHIDRVEIKDVALPETMKRSMSRQAEAERERRARVISAEGELQASTGWRRPLQRWPIRRARSSCGCWRPSLRWPRRRTPLWCCPSPSSCCDSWKTTPA